ncbi:DUF5133 domain-containing protein [Streptomyces sp. NPDC006333]|uniref:DUF5133 domain-containing protein n=1 Tax=Streptomyces sp. NPDC006333 TaxID=3156753 RepID=UPI0033A9D6CD
MLMPLPATLRVVIDGYERLLAQEALAPTTAGNARIRDIEYTLCVSTGTRDIADASQTARSYLTTAPADAFTSAVAPGPGTDRRATVAPSRGAGAGSAEGGQCGSEGLPAVEGDEPAVVLHAACPSGVPSAGVA